MGKRRVPNESVTFRIDNTILNELRRESEQKQVSLNTSVNQIFRQYVDWYANAAKAGYMALPKPLIVKLMNKISDEEAVELAEYIAKNEIKDTILMLRKQYDLASLLDVLESWLKVSGISYRHEVNDTKNTYILQHDMGRRWSLHLAETIRSIFEDVSSKRAELEVNDNTIVFEFNNGS